jgi:hypothetical protein
MSIARMVAGDERQTGSALCACKWLVVNNVSKGILTRKAAFACNSETRSRRRERRK